MSDNNYIKKQSKHVNDDSKPENFRKDAGWRILSNIDENDLSSDGTLTDSQWQKAQEIAKDSDSSWNL